MLKKFYIGRKTEKATVVLFYTFTRYILDIPNDKCKGMLTIFDKVSNKTEIVKNHVINYPLTGSAYRIARSSLIGNYIIEKTCDSYVENTVPYYCLSELVDELCSPLQFTLPTYIISDDYIRIQCHLSEKLINALSGIISQDIIINSTIRHITNNIPFPEELVVLLYSMKHFHGLDAFGDMKDSVDAMLSLLIL